jgi:2-polyprenyl-3-methyl-5-hydroxy-6-metoxy-1,4-benzoquinol methylase
MDILIAGCGANQAAYYAVRHPKSKILAIDLSESSLAHQEKLKQKHGLKNLTLLKYDLTKVEELEKDFDFITSTGVLHHLPNPDVGLKALKRVLRKDGVINLMLYGRSLRLGVYVMQEFFKLLGFEQKKDDVDLVRSLQNSNLSIRDFLHKKRGTIKGKEFGF